MKRARYQVIEQMPNGVQYITYHDKKPNIGQGRINPWQSLDTKTGKISQYTQKLINSYNEVIGLPTLKLA